MESSFHQRLQHITERVHRAAERAGRPPSDIRIVGVSKRHSVASCRVALESGLLDLGENYVQEWQEKAVLLQEHAPPAHWHFIGALQSNKAKRLVREDVLIHTVDRISLARTLAKEASRLEKQVSILIQMNEAREPQKSGVLPEDFPELVTTILEYPQLSIRGLMCIPPSRTSEKERRGDFRALRNRLDQLNRMDERLIHARELSMGMSNDFEWAVEEGATLIRIGTALFGPRPD